MRNWHVNHVGIQLQKVQIGCQPVIGHPRDCVHGEPITIANFVTDMIIIMVLNDDYHYGFKCKETSGKKSKFQMGFEPTTLCDLVGYSNHWATASGDSGEQAPFCGSWLVPHHAATQPSNDLHTWTH